MSEKEWPKMQSYFNVIKTTTDPAQAKNALIGASQIYQRMIDTAKENYQNEWAGGQWGDKTVIDRLGNTQPSTGKIIVTDPKGGEHPFETQLQADAFKRAAGIR
jgi:hypothetical protein